MAEMTVPLVALPGGLWGSPNAAWDHLIKRESSGRPQVIQEIRDVNSGGNEAEGLFQITPKTWERHGGKEFAPSARSATPQQQAIVAARIIQRNPSGSDWGAGRPGRESGAALMAGLVPVGAAAPRAVEPYGMPRGSNSGGYGNNGVRFPDWVYALGNAFGLKPSTYPGHQESNRNEAGYAPNPQGLNRGIDWAAPGAPDEVDRMQRFAEYLLSISGELEQVIWENPRTGKRIGVAGGNDVSATAYFGSDYANHRNHVHTRQSHSLPIPGGAPPQPPKPALSKPAYTEILAFNGRKNSSVRSRPPINFFIHTQEGSPDATAKDLSDYCQGQNNVSYHYTIRNGIVYCPVDTDYYSWSVLSANVFSINLCFAGSSVNMTRQQWLDRYGRDIEIAAYLAVQDCRKYNFSTEVLAPQWNRQGPDVYTGEPRAGISDHNYVTRELGIGNHTDCGPNFPWDVFTRYVNKYANPTSSPGDDMAQVPQEQWDRVYRELTQLLTSRSPLRPLNAGPMDTLAGFALYTNGGQDVEAVRYAAELGHPKSLARLHELADADPARYPDRADNIKFAQAILADIEAKKQQSVTTKVSGGGNGTSGTATVYVDNSRELSAAYAEIERLRAENASLREQVQVPSTALAVVEPAADVTASTSGDVAGKVVDSLEDWTERVLSMDVKQRASLAKSLEALQLPNGTQP